MPYSSTSLTLPVYGLLRVTVSAPHVVPANFFMRTSRTWGLASAFLVSCKVFHKSPQDQIVGTYGSQDFRKHVSDDVVDEDKE